jgi:N-acyl-D-aspartate/D-glutamate deacylase
MAFDLLIKDAIIVDGSGDPSYQGDIAISDGRIAEVGTVSDGAHRVIDAGGAVVCPGFVDVHTHYDAQVMWDPSVSPSSLHGVTTVIGGNCGFTIAPIDNDSADYVMRMLACVEGMPVEALENAVDFKWNTFEQWLARLEGTLAVNAGFLVGHSTVRKLVMRDEWQQIANTDQLEEMATVVDESIRGGALGFSSSWGVAHGDHLGNLVPSRYADAGELLRLASVLRSHPGTMLEFIPPNPPWSEELVDMMVDMSRQANAPLNWNLLTIGGGFTPEMATTRLAASDRAAAAGAEIVALSVPMPLQLRLNLRTAILFNVLPEWQEVFTLPLEEKKLALSDPQTRERLRRAVERHGSDRTLWDFEKMKVQGVASPRMIALEGRLVGEIARERGVSALDALLDIALEDDLVTCFETAKAGDDENTWRQRARHWQDPRVLVAGSDAGAHLDMLATFAFYTDFVGPTVRDRKLISLENAVHQITDAPARLYGLRDRGRIMTGYLADLVVLDPDVVATGRVVLRDDLPGNELRLYADAVGIEHVFVNGVEIVTGGEITGAAPGTILRPGRDTSARLSPRFPGPSIPGR